MNPKIAKIAVRAVGTIAALPGLRGLYAFAFMDQTLFGDIMPWMGAFLAVSLIVDVWLIWIGYLVWFRFSPLAVRQTCGFLGVLAIFLFAFALSGWMDRSGAGWYSLAFLGWIVFVLAAYRLLSRYLNGVIALESRTPLNFMPPLPKR